MFGDSTGHSSRSPGGDPPRFLAKRQQMPWRPGVLTAADPFFWFCHGDFYLYTFPANQVHCYGVSWAAVTAVGLALDLEIITLVT